MALQDRVKSKVSEALKNYGQPITIRTINTTYDSATRKRTTADPADNIINGVIESYKSSEIIGLIEAGDIKITTENDGTAPKQDNLIIIGGDTLSIIHIEPIYFRGDIMAYTIQARR